MARYNIKVSEEDFNNIIEELVRDEVKKGVQMIQYQINTLMTSNGKLKRSGRVAQGYANETDGEPICVGCEYYVLANGGTQL